MIEIQAIMNFLTKRKLDWQGNGFHPFPAPYARVEFAIQPGHSPDYLVIAGSQFVRDVD